MFAESEQFPEMSSRSRVHEIQEDWKPSFLSNEEFTHIILESVDGFIAVFSLSGNIIYTSGSVISLLGHLPVSPKKKKITTPHSHKFFTPRVI